MSFTVEVTSPGFWIPQFQSCGIQYPHLGLVVVIHHAVPCVCSVRAVSSVFPQYCPAACSYSAQKCQSPPCRLLSLLSQQFRQSTVQWGAGLALQAVKKKKILCRNIPHFMWTLKFPVRAIHKMNTGNCFSPSYMVLTFSDIAVYNFL